jgi:mannose-6-phosphate isomerase-like protein (cupin superfamily)
MSPAFEPRVVWLPGDLRHEVHATGEETGGAFCMFVDHPPAGWGLPWHRHLEESETIHILEGEFEVELEGEQVALKPGSTIHVPKGAAHKTQNVGAGPGRRVTIFSPAGPEGFFLEAGAPAPGQPVDVEAYIAAAARYGFVLVEGPGPSQASE